LNNKVNLADPTHFSDKAYRQSITAKPDADEVETLFVQNQVDEVASKVYQQYKDEPEFLQRVALALAKRSLK
jgi:hypothetical protein